MKELLKEFNACQEARDWVGDKTLEEAWNTCHRGDWMLWLYRRMYPDNLRELTLAKGHCANTVRHLMKDKRSLKAVDMAIAFGEGRTDRYEFGKAYANAAADAAAYAVYAVYAADADAADAAAAAAAAAAAYAYADDAAAAAAYAADAYADAADAAAYAAAADAAYAYADDAAAAAAYAYADDAAAAAAKKQNQQLTADICRQYLKIV